MPRADNAAEARELLMAHGATTADTLVLDRQRQAVPARPEAGSGTIEVRLTHRLADVEAAWQVLSATVESPGQDIGFIRLWLEALRIAPADQFYILAHRDGLPLALMPLQRRWDKAARVLSWFPGAHVGCNAPLVDSTRLAAMGASERRALWSQMLGAVRGADLVYLKSVPQLVVDGVDIFAELGSLIAADTLYRAAFVSFEEADTTQRNKSRRKHDRQQGEKLAAMGPIEFDAVGNGPEAVGLLDTLFRQRAARFREMGVFDPFAVPAIRGLYDATAREGSGVGVKLHVLKLKGEVVAMRYNVVHGDRLFCLISSMSEDPALRPGSPGKQCLLRVMQIVFAEGYRVFDMGEGLTDEKRHWCNVQVPVRHHYLPVTAWGAAAASAHRGLHRARARIKSDPRLLAAAKGVRGMLLKLMGRSSARVEAAED